MNLLLEKIIDLLVSFRKSKFNDVTNNFIEFTKKSITSLFNTLFRQDVKHLGKKILIGLPAYGGMLNTEFLLSFVETVAGLRDDGFDYALYVISNESFIQRARNKIANEMLSGNYDALLFIDSDIGWKYWQLRELLFSDKKVIGGTYPMKTLPIALNFNVLPEHQNLFSHRKSEVELKQLKDKFGNKKGEVEVLHIPTGFMLIDKQVFLDLKDKVGYYHYTDFHTKKQSIMYDYFPGGVMEDHVFLSEDFGFCKVCREHGIPIYLNANIITTHTGTYTFRAVV